MTDTEYVPTNWRAVIGWAAGTLAVVALLALAIWAPQDPKPRTDAEWCADQATPELLAALSWSDMGTKPEFIDECLQALDGGYSRPLLVELYDEYEANWPQEEGGNDRARMPGDA